MFDFFWCPLRCIGAFLSEAWSVFFRQKMIFSPHQCGVFVFSLASRRPSSAVVRRRPPSSAAALSHTHITKLISSYTSHVTSYTTHPTSHTTHLTHNSSHTTHLTQTTHNTTHLTPLISHNNSSHTQLISHNSSHTQLMPRLLFVWQAQYTERPEGAAARIVAGVAAAALCVAGAVHRAS